MRIEIENLGPIRSFAFDLDKDLHLIFGRNNIGKSYAISAVYLLVKHLIHFELVRAFDDYSKTQLYERSENELAIPKWSERIIAEFHAAKQTKQDITSHCAEEFKTFFNEVWVPALSESFMNSFDGFQTIQNQFTDNPFVIRLINEHMTLSLGMSPTSEGLTIQTLTLKKRIYIKQTKEPRAFTASKKTWTFYLPATGNAEIDSVIYLCARFLLFDTVQQLENVYFLPSSRSGLYSGLSSFSAMVAELSQQRNRLTRLTNKLEIPNIPEPVSDYFLNLSSIKNASVLNEDLMALATEMETTLLQGQVVFNSDTRKILYQPQNLKLQLDMAFTSSMISEIAPIIAHFKFIIADKSRRLLAQNKSPKISLIFIEEPEAHLHPELQVQLTILFAKLIRYNVKVVMTTHSNYIFNKLNNLVLAGDVTAEQLSIALMTMGPKGSVVKENAMSVHDDGIEDDNFSDVAEQLYNERLTLYDDYNAKDHTRPKD